VTKVPSLPFLRPWPPEALPADTELGKEESHPRLEAKAMFDKILVAIDHSEISDRALAAARDLALLSKGEVWVLHLREREIATKTGVVLTDETADEVSAAVAADKLTVAGFKRTATSGPRYSAMPRGASSTTRSSTTSMSS
jgi:hypothetical protein